MYHLLACPIRVHFALLATYVLSLVYFRQTVLKEQNRVDTSTLPTYYKRFDYVLRIELIAFHPTFWVSHPLRGLTYSRIKL